MEFICNKRLGLALALSFIAVACAAPTIPNDGAEQEDDDITSESGSTKKPTKPGTTTTTNPNNPAPSPAPTQSPTPSPSSTPTTPPPGQPPPAAGNCAAAADGEACFQCCDQASGGELAKADEAFFTCACDAQCAAQCGQNFCNGQQPDAACETCLTNTCEPAFVAACSSAACKAGDQCLQTSCANKQ